MNDAIRWGILGTGHIAGEFVRGLRDAQGAIAAAVGSRSMEKAARFGEEFGIPRRHGSYAELAADAAVDVVYIATPHPLHAENIRLCLEAGKPVLCEKPLTISASQARQVIALAEARGLFLMEAMWTRFLPSITKLRQILAEQRIGPPRLVSADLGIAAPFEARSRLFDPALGGGCLLDLGVYPLSLAAMVLGRPAGATGQAFIGQSGVDEQEAIVLNYAGGALASIYCSLRTATPRQAAIIGIKGYVHLYSDWWKGGPMILMEGNRATEIAAPVAGNGYQYEADEVARCLRAGRLCSEVMPPEQSLEVLVTMDQLRQQWKLRYPMEQ